ncbi:LIM-domain binding protein-domain-containing protein [Aspergillus unguis]
MAQPFAAHPGMAGHPGLPPGHALPPGQHPNAHPGTMVQQVHPGVSGPGPQVSQGGPMMGQMPPGAGTTGPGGPVQAHALSHLGPQPQLLTQQQFAQNFGGNPHLYQQHQQNMLRQRMMFPPHQGQPQPHQPQPQPQHGALSVSLPNGTQAMNAAQMVAMQNPAMRPATLQQMQQLQQMSHGQPNNIQQQQFLAMQQAAQVQAQAQAQAQAQQAQQAQQQNAAVQPGQHTPQQRPAPQPQNVHEAQSVTPQPQPGPPPHQGSATPQPNPSQAPSSQPPQQQPAVTQQSQPTPNITPQQLPQGQQPGQQPQQSQQPPQGQQPPPQNQSQPQPQPGQQHPGQQQGQQPHPIAAQEALKAQHQQQQNAAMYMQQQRMATRGQAILALNGFAEQLSNFQSRGEAADLAYWTHFVDRFYSPIGVLRQGVYNPQSGAKQFEIATPALARYYFTQFSSGVRQIQMLVEGPRERDSPQGGHFVECHKASFIYWFTNDAQLFTTGTLKAHFDIQNKIEMLDLVVMNHTEYLPRSQLQALELDQKQSPKLTKNGKRAQQKQPQQPAITLPESMVTANGVTPAVLEFLEVAETMSQMQHLFSWSQQNPHLSPLESLRSCVSNMQNGQLNANPAFMQGPMNPALQQGPNSRAPSMGGPNQFASPAMGHLNLPIGGQGSPHLSGSAHASPGQSNLAGPHGVGPQGQMQQQVTSASASPNVSNKRRRASTVKMEGEDGGGEVNGAAPGSAKVKASPRVGGKRQKGTAS